MRSRHSLAALAFALALAPAAALAEASAADRASARVLAREGESALARRDFAEARDRFSRADSLIHAPTLMLGIAQAEVGLGQLVAAQETLARIVREGAPPKSPPSWDAAIAEAKRELALLTPRIPSVTITVASAAEARVTIDGAPVPSAALGAKRPVDPGQHVIRGELAGFAPVEVHVTLVEGKNEPVTLAPTVTLGSPRRGLGVVALVVGGAGLVLGGVTGAVAIAKHSALEKVCTDGSCPESASSTVSAYHLTGALSTVGFIAGGAFVAAGAILSFTAPASPTAKPASAAWLAPAIGPGYIGIEGGF